MLISLLLYFHQNSFKKFLPKSSYQLLGTQISFRGSTVSYIKRLYLSFLFIILKRLTTFSLCLREHIIGGRSSFIRELGTHNTSPLISNIYVQFCTLCIVVVQQVPIYYTFIPITIRDDVHIVMKQPSSFLKQRLFQFPLYYFN